MRLRGCGLAAVALLCLHGCGNTNSLQLGSATATAKPSPTPVGPTGCNAPGSICSLGATGVGDGGPALSSLVLGPTSLAVDKAGNLYVAEGFGNRLREILGASSSGVISTLAGTGQDFFGIIGNPGPETPVGSPNSVAVTPDGWVMWSETVTCSIWGIPPEGGAVTQLAGTGSCGNPKTAPPRVSAPQSVSFNFNTSGGGLLVDSAGNLAFPDGANVVWYYNRGASPITVWNVTVPAGQLAVVAGTGVAGFGGDGTQAAGALFNTPTSAVILSNGSLVISDAGNSRLRQIDANGVVNTVAGTGAFGDTGDSGPANAAELNYPEGLGRYGAGLVVVDAASAIRLVNLSSAPISFGSLTVAPASIDTIVSASGREGYLESNGGLALDLQLSNGTVSMASVGSELFVGDEDTDVIWRVDSVTGTMSVMAGLGPGAQVSTYFDRPSSLAIGSNGTLYLAANNAYVWSIPAAGLPVVVAGNGATDASGDTGPAIDASLWGAGVAVDQSGALYIADPNNSRVRRIDPNGTIGTIAGTGVYGTTGNGSAAEAAELGAPLGVALDTAGDLFILSYDSTIRVVNRGTAVKTIAGVSVGPGDIETVMGGGGCGFGGDGGPGTDALFCPFYNGNFYSDVVPPAYFEVGLSTFGAGMAVSGGVLYFPDYNNYDIRSLNLATGIVESVVVYNFDGNPPVAFPTAVAVFQGYLYWTEQYGSYLLRMPLPWGEVEVVAGTGSPGDSGDGGPAIDAELMLPGGLAIRSDGVIFVADGSHRVREIVP